MSIWGYEIKKILEQEQERLFLWIPVVFAAGIAFYFSLGFEPSLWLSLVIIESLIVLAYVWRGYVERLRILGWLAVFVLGFVNIQVRAYHINTVPLLTQEKTLYLKGYVETGGYNYRGKQYLILDKMRDFDDKTIVGQYRITPLHLRQKINVGDCVETVANMRPLMQPNLVGSYQFNRKQFFDGIKATGYTDVSVNKINCAELGVKPDFWLPMIQKIRDNIIDRIYHILPSQTAGIAAAIIAGEQGKISAEQIQNYRDSGLAHFLSISGLHLGMIAGLMFLIVRWSLACFPKIALKYDTKKIAAVLAIIMSFIYLVISGWQVATQRAFIMTFLVLLSVLVGRSAISIRTVAWAALVILILEPQYLISAGFQMSFAAVIMLIAFYEKYAGKIHNFWCGNKKDSWLLRSIRLTIVYLMGIVIADFVASMATLPFAVYHFNRVSVYTSLANLLAGPVIGLWIMPGVLVSLLLLPLGIEKYALIITGKGIEVVNQITEYVAHLENASCQVLSMPTWGFAFIVIGGLWLALWQMKWRHGGWLLIIIGFVSIFTVRLPDVIVDSKAKTFAVKTSCNEIVILPNRGNYFTKKMWQEKLAQSSLNDNEKEKLRDIYNGKMTDKNWLPLSCNDKQCVYNDKIVLYKKGGIFINGKDYSQSGALVVYGTSRQPTVKTVEQWSGNRYWTLNR